MNMYTTPFTVEFLGTPEAGKTTTIHRIKEELEKTLNISILQESAEIVPSYFQKASIEAHMWMRLTTARALLEKKAVLSPNDLFLIDRGIVDTLFWNYYYETTGMLPSEMVSHANSFFKGICGLPDLVIFLTTTPEEAVRRRGGEGRIVTLDFVKNFNNKLNFFMKQVSTSIYRLDTTNLSKDEVFSNVAYQIIQSYAAAKI